MSAYHHLVRFAATSTDPGGLMALQRTATLLTSKRDRYERNTRLIVPFLAVSLVILAGCKAFYPDSHPHDLTLQIVNGLGLMVTSALVVSSVWATLDARRSALADEIEDIQQLSELLTARQGNAKSL